jgi:hypothetical protein
MNYDEIYSALVHFGSTERLRTTAIHSHSLTNPVEFTPYE